MANEGVKQLDTEKTYRNVMERYKFGGVSRPGLYIDETVMRMCYTHRTLMAQLAKTLLKEGKDQKALAVLQKCEKELPYYNVPVNFRSGSFDMAETYALLGKKAETTRILDRLWTNAEQYMKFYLSLSQGRFTQSQNDCLTQLYVMQRITQIASLIDEGMASKLEEKLNSLAAAYSARGGQVF